MSEAKVYCNQCHDMTWQTVPGYTCTVCGHQEKSSGIGLELGLAGLVIVGIFAAFLAVNSLLVLPTLIIHPWGLVGSVLLMRWLWQRDHLARESIWLRYGVSAFITIWVAALIVSILSELFHLHLFSIAKELLLITLPGVALGFAATKFLPRLTGKLWPVFLGICLAHTIGKVTILGWIANSF